jgi:hypothetical protein
MTKTIIFSFIVLISLNSLANGGDFYRFKVKIKLNDNSELVGYTYFGTYGLGFNSDNERFIEFVKREFKFPILIYQNIKTVISDSNLQFDFSMSSLCKKIQIDDIKDIEQLSLLKYSPGQRLFELSEREYELVIDRPALNVIIYNESFSENCSYILFAWSDIEDFIDIKNKIQDKINELTEKKEYNEVHKYIKKTKEELLKKKILIIQSCTDL